MPWDRVRMLADPLSISSKFGTAYLSDLWLWEVGSNLSNHKICWCIYLVMCTGILPYTETPASCLSLKVLCSTSGLWEVSEIGMYREWSMSCDSADVTARGDIL